MRKNEKGSSLIFALAVISIITMVIAACMAISYSYYNRSIVANSERQAYLTAKSVLTNIVDNIVAKDGDYLGLIPEQGKGEVSYNVDDRFPSSEMGTVDSIKMIRNLDEKDENDKFLEKLTVSVTVTYGKSNKQINADLKQYDGDDENWQLSKYYESEVDNKINNNITKADNMIKETTELYNLVQKGDKNGIYDLLLPYKDQLKDSIYNNFIVNNCLSNNLLRAYVYRILFNGNSPELNINEMTLSETAKKSVKAPLYVHIMFGSQSDYKCFVIYATSNPAGDVTDWKPTLVYLPETGHWYYSKDFNYNMGNINSSNAQSIYEEIIKKCYDGEIVQ